RPLLYRAAGNTWELFDEKMPGLLDQAHATNTGITNLPLGILAPTRFPQFAIRLEPGDIVVSYTDCLTESNSPSGEGLGEEGLLRLVRGLESLEPPRLGPALLERVAEWRGGSTPDDDETLLVLRHNASDPPDNAWARMKALGRLVGLVK